MNATLDYARLLLQQQRFGQAEAEVRRVLSTEPEHAEAVALLALCLSGQRKHAAAIDAARSAVALSPDSPIGHYVLAVILDGCDRLEEAKIAVRNAIHLDPTDPDFFALLGSLHAQQKQWSEALCEADRGLALDAEHVDSANVRAMALVGMGRKSEADSTIAAALAHDPENALTHANRGWTMLHAGRHQEAMIHFREALRLDPNLEWARLGIVEAMKARYFLYRLMLRFFLFTSSLSSRARWGVILGGYFGFRVVSKIARTTPELEPYLMPVVALYLVFVVLTWIAKPMFNLLLRLDKFGRQALSPDETRFATLFGLCILAALLSATLGSLLINPAQGLIGALLFGVLVLPVSAIHQCGSGWPRVLMGVYTGLIFLLGLGSWLLGVWQAVNAAAVTAGEGPGLGMMVCLLGSALSTWIALGLSSVAPRRSR